MPKAKQRKSMGRRSFFTAVGASAGAVVIAKATGASAQDHAPAAGPIAATRPTAPAVAAPHIVPAILAPLRPGTRLDRWIVVHVHPVKLGAVPVVLVGEAGAPFQVDVLRRDPGVSGVGESPSLAVYVANGGAGAQPTHEDHGLAAMALASYLTERERAGAPVPELLTHAQRTSRHRRGVFSVLE